jgi:transcriptional regulator with XRE-family HTH domain
MTNLRKRREAAGLSRYKLALASGVSPETIYGIETRGVKTSADNAVKLANALGTTVEDLMGEPDEVSA